VSNLHNHTVHLATR